MSEPPHVPAGAAGQPAALERLQRKESRAARALAGPWKRTVELLGAAMVLFYLYAAGIASVGTQYHRGVYVFITYVLVFLFYPAGAPAMRALVALFGGTLLSFGLGSLAYPDVAAWHAQLTRLHGIWPLVAGALPAALGLFQADRYVARRWPASPTASDVLLALASAGVVSYWIREFENLNYRAGAETELDALVSVVGVVLSLEVCRRVLGWPMTVIGAAMLGYAYFGPYFPEIVAHRGFGLERLCTALFLTTNGVFGVMANVLATYVILFIFFGAFLQKSGAARFFIDLPLSLAGRSAGGPAKGAVIASALFGSVSGSAIANTVSTGAFTIPLMKRTGFKPEVAGAIEPAASIGGMFLPPVMGAGGFLMAELTGTPYASIMLIAVVPALLYFLSVFCMIHFEARKQGIQGVAAEQVTPWRTLLRRDGYFALPLLVVTVLMILGRSPGYAAFWASLACIAVSWVRPATRMGPREIWQAICTGAHNTLIIGATLGVIGIIVGTISLTGVGLKFSDIIISLAGGHLLVAVLLVGLASLVLGMGVPVTAAYLITAVLAVPPLMDMGVVLIAAHMIVYWFSQDSNITPPVCVAAYAGAAIAGADPWKTGWTAFKFAKLLYVMPLLFAFTPAILFEGRPLRAPHVDDDIMGALVLDVKVAAGQPFAKGDLVALLLDGDVTREVRAPWNGEVKQLAVSKGQHVTGNVVIAETRAPASAVLSSMLSAALGTVAFAALTMFYLIRRTTLPEWLLLAAATVLLYWPTLTTDLAGLAIVAGIVFVQRAKNRRDEAALAEAAAARHQAGDPSAHNVRL